MKTELIGFMKKCIETQNKSDEMCFLGDNRNLDIIKDMDDEVQKYWEMNKLFFYEILWNGDCTPEDIDVIGDFMSIIRGDFFINDTYKTIKKSYQEMCAFYIAFLLKNHLLGVGNYLRYFDPESAYYMRVSALNMFRVLANPKSEIESVFHDVSDTLYKSVLLDPNSKDQAIGILKEYLSRVFELTRVDVDSRVDFISAKDNESWDFRCSTGGISGWIVGFLSDESQSPSVKDLPENIVVELPGKQSDEGVETSHEEPDGVVVGEKTPEKIEVVEPKPVDINVVVTSSTSKIHDRSLYKIAIIGGSVKCNKKYIQLMKSKPTFLREFGVEWKQLGEPLHDYSRQKDRSFAKTIKDGILLGNIDFAIALQTDHDTPIANLLNDPDVGSRITYFGEQGGNQKFSQDKFKRYFKLALDKYEQEMENTYQISKC